MTTDLNELFKTTVSETLSYQASELFGESVESTSSAINAIFPALLSAAIGKGTTDHGAREIIEYLSANNIDGSILKDLPGILSGGPEVETLKANGADILKFLVGDRTSDMIDAVSTSHGLRTSSASSLLKIVATLLMTALATVVNEKNLKASGLKELLTSQSAYVKDSVPPSLQPIIQSTYPVPPVQVAHGTLNVPNMDTPDERSTLSKLLPWIVLLIAALGLFYFLEKSGEPSPSEIQKMNTDSIENARRLDSIRTQIRLDSINNQIRVDSLAKKSQDTMEM